MRPAELLRQHLRDAYADLTSGASVLVPRARRLVPADGHFHLRTELHLQRRAGIRFRFFGETLDLRPGQALLVPPRVYHAETVLPADQEFCNVVVYADEGSLSCHLADTDSRGRPRVAYPERVEGPRCTPVAAWLEDAATLAGDGAEAVATDLVRSIVGLALRLLDQSAGTGEREPLPVVRCRQLIHEDLGDPALSVASLARRVGCSPDYLSHLFRQVRGEKLTAYIEEKRLLRAAELLVRTSLSCKEVGWASGFANQSYFVQRFRLRWRHPPLEYRAVQTAAGAPGVSSRSVPSG